MLSAAGGTKDELVARAKNFSFDERARSGDARHYVEKFYEWSKAVDLCSPSDLAGAPEPPKFHVVAYDLRHEAEHSTEARAGRLPPDCLFPQERPPTMCSRSNRTACLSNGPGDPEPLEYPRRRSRSMVGHVPIFGICLGHQILGSRSAGRRTS